METIIGTGFSTKDDPFQAGQHAALQARQNILRPSPKLIIVFSSIHFRSPKLLEGIYSVFGNNTCLLGGTGAGVITSTGIHKYGVVILAVQSQKISFSTAAVHDINKSFPRESGSQFARQALKNLQTKTREMALVFFDGLTEQGSELLGGIKEVFGRSFPIIGGSTADNLRFAKTYQYFNKEVLNNALIGTILAGDGVFGYGVRHGWQPLGRAHTVTSSRGNVINEIEHKPAVEIYEPYFKKSLDEIQSLFSQISILYPLGIFLPGEKEYLLRNPIRVTASGGLVCQGDTPVNSQIKLMMGTKETALQAVRQATIEAKHELHDSPVLACLVFQAVSRTKLLGYRAREEIDIIKNVLRTPVPLIGMCTYGEQAPLKSYRYQGESHLHNETITIVTMGERRVSTKHA